MCSRNVYSLLHTQIELNILSFSIIQPFICFLNLLYISTMSQGPAGADLQCTYSEDQSVSDLPVTVGGNLWIREEYVIGNSSLGSLLLLHGRERLTTIWRWICKHTQRLPESTLELHGTQRQQLQDNLSLNHIEVNVSLSDLLHHSCSQCRLSTTAFFIHFVVYAMHLKWAFRLMWLQHLYRSFDP